MKNKVLNKILLILFICLVLVTKNPIEQKADILYPILNAKANLLMDADSGIIYLADNIDQQLGIASLTKLMSMYVVYDEIEAQGIKDDDIVIISQKVAALRAGNPDISGVVFEPGQEMTVGELIDLSLVFSDNGAIIALSEKVSGSEEEHVKKMNQKAEKLGMDDTVFYNVSGLTMSDYGDYQLEGSSPKDYNKSSARDMGLLCYNLLKDYPQILDITSKTTLDYKGYELNTYNQLLPDQPLEYEGVKGLKTGTSNEAGQCFIGYLETEDRNYISIILNAPYTVATNRYLETIMLYEWAKEQRYSTIFSEDTPLTTLHIKGSKQKNVDLYSNNVDILTNDKVYLQLLETDYNDEYFDENNYLIKDIEPGEVLITLKFETPEDTINLQTIFSDDNILVVNLVAKDKISRQNNFMKIFSSVGIFLQETFNNI